MPGWHPQYSFEPLADRDRSAFHCGVPELDDYFQRQASQDVRRKVAAVFVMVGPDRSILGFYTLSAYSVRVSELPTDLAKKLPKYPLIPATLLGRLAVGQPYRGQKLGTLLLMDALHRSWKNSAQVASIGVVAEALNEDARNFYLHHEFIPLAERHQKLFISMNTIQKAFA